MTKLFFDESGNSGYLEFFKDSDSPKFSGHPFFTLSGILIDSANYARFEDVFSKACSEKDINTELKSEDAYQGYPDLICELFKSCPDLFESNTQLVEKRYLISTSITEHGLMKGADKKYNHFKQCTATYLHNSLQNTTLKQWIEAQQEEAGSKLMESYIQIAQDLTNGGFKEIGDAFLDEGADFEDSYIVDIDREHFRKLVEACPVDKPKKLLSPHTSSFAAIVAFFNAQKVISKIIHDETSEMKSVLPAVLAYMRTIAGATNSMPAVPSVYDYGLANDVEISFVDSESSKGVQLADLLAGTVMRYFRDWKSGKNAKLLQHYDPLIRQLHGVIGPFFVGSAVRLHAACLSFITGVIPPMPILGRSLL